MAQTEEIFGHLQEGDGFYAEMGGPNSAFLLRVLDKEVRIFRIPFARLGKGKLTKETKEDEGDKQEGRRKQRAIEIMELAKTQPELFYPLISPDRPILELQVIYYIWQGVMQNYRIPAQLRFQTMQRDAHWLWGEKRSRRERRLLELFSDRRDIVYFQDVEKAALNQAEGLLGKIPVWKDYLSGVYGIGPSLSTRLIAEIGDIRRFPKRDGFRHYAAWHVMDGRAPFLRRKQVVENGETEESDKRDTFSPGLKQAFWLAGEQFVRSGEKSEYYKVYLKRKAQELTAGKNKMHAHSRAKRYAVSKFVEELWNQWWQVLERQGEELPLSVRQILHPVSPEPSAAG